MTKLIVPQIGDIVRGQVVTEAAHKLWVDMASKLDALEGVANDDLADELTALGERIDAVIATEKDKPKIEIIVSGEELGDPQESGFDLYQITCEFSMNINVTSTSVSLRLYNGASGYFKNVAGVSYNAASGLIPIIGSITAHLTTEDFNYVEMPIFGLIAVRSGSAITITPVRWIIHKYKSEY